MSDIRYLQPNNKKVETLQKQRLILGLIFLILLLSACLLLLLNYKGVPKKAQDQRISQKITRLIGKGISLPGINRINLSIPDNSNNKLAFSYQEKNSYKQLILQLQETIHKSKYQIHKMITLPSGSGFSFQINTCADSLFHIFFIYNGKTPKLSSYLERQISQPPRLAIIISNFGYVDNSTLQNILSLPLDLTIAVTPGNQYSEWSQNRAFKEGKEVIIHMPMEANDTTLGKKEEYFLSEDMNYNQVANDLMLARKELSFAFGMDNYMGSKATKSRDLMYSVMDFVKKEGLYFIDNLNCLESRANSIAREKEIPTGVRNLFINTTNKIDSVRANLEEALIIAQRNGRAIAIAQANSNTLETLKKFIKSNHFDKTEVCFASEIVQ